MAGGSRILINDQGITISTGGKILYQAGQHKFEGGQQVKAEIPPLPIVNDIKTFTNKWDFYDLFYQSDFSDVKYKLINNKNHTYVSGGLDEHGRTQRMTTSNNENHDLLIGTDDDWTVSMDDESDDDDFQYDCSCGSQEDHEHEGEL
jgi:type VI secretion system secreted protein VgrG